LAAPTDKMDLESERLSQARSLYQTVRLIKGHLVRHFNQRVATKDQNKGYLELTFPQSNALQTVGDRGELTVKELAEALHVSAPSASSMVERLVEQGMLVREQSRVDRREVRIRLSDAGQETLAAMEDHMMLVFLHMLEKLGPELSRQWCEVYARIREELEHELASETAASHEGVQ